ncbi:MAG: glutamate racemase [Rectinemataceae bacterium]|nr:glutamate racemase [Rectinemataceae bacterium]
MNSSGSVVFFDSGVGGLPYLAEARNLLPGTVLHYIADDAGFPYGTKTPAQLESILLDRVRRLRARFLPSALVIACNTASQIGLDILRKAHPDLPIIGTVPAIKPAAASTISGRIGVMATERTVVDPYIDDLIARYASDVEVFKLPAQDLVSFVEHRYFASSDKERRSAVEPYIRTLVDRGVDRIILACTHFLHLEKDIAECAKALGAEDFEIVDSRVGVARRLAQIVEGLRVSDETVISSDKKGRFLLTSDPPFDSAYAQWAEHFDLLPPELL